MLIAGIGVVLFFLACAATVVAIGTRGLPVTTTGHTFPAPPALRKTERPADYPYTPQLRARRDALIAAGLRLGYTPGQIAEVWRYAPRSVGRRAAVLAGKGA
jgi:hypothetical protein